MRISMRLPTLGAAAVVLIVGAAPLLAAAADHLDAPALGGLSGPMNTFAPHSEHPDRDINDVYVFQGANATKTVLAMTVNPGTFFGERFGTGVRYNINVDTTGDAVEDITYRATFGAVGSGPDQKQAVTLRRNGAVVASGATGNTVKVAGGGKLWAGVRSDPFFFDLTGFAGTVAGLGSDALGDDPTDFFVGLNTSAIVLEVPDSALGRHIGVWGETEIWDGSSWVTADQMGRPAINTVFNTGLVDPSAGTTKNQFNTTPPSQQATAFGGKFRTNIIATLTNINAALGTGGADYSVAQAEAIANLLLPDVITYDTSTTAAGPLNGRALADDVIDIELGLTTNGSVTSDGVPAHGDYLSVFPYLGVPH